MWTPRLNKLNKKCHKQKTGTGMSHRSTPSPRGPILMGPYTGLIRKSYRSVGESRDMLILYEMNANPSILFTIDMKFHFGHRYLISLL